MGKAPGIPKTDTLTIGSKPLFLIFSFRKSDSFTQIACSKGGFGQTTKLVSPGANGR